MAARAMRLASWSTPGACSSCPESEVIQCGDHRRPGGQVSADNEQDPIRYALADSDWQHHFVLAHERASFVFVIHMATPPTGHRALGRACIEMASLCLCGPSGRLEVANSRRVFLEAGGTHAGPDVERAVCAQGGV